MNADFSGALFPVLANRHKSIGVPDWIFFIVKYFGSGVIVATAFIHVSGHSSLHGFRGRQTESFSDIPRFIKLSQSGIVLACNSVHPHMGMGNGLSN